ncbi:MAG: universal stress protein [Nitrospirae bacterium]|nr:universal stress protein [Nitrospirota bacterium]
MNTLKTDADQQINLRKTMYETILAGYDDSLNSRAALIEASNWIKKHGGKLIMVHAVYFDTEEFGIAPEQLEKRLKLGEKVCVQTKERLTSEFGIEVQSLLCEGDPPTVVVDIAKEKKADLIVLGTYGRRGINRLLMGSVTSQVIVNSPVDVLVVKKPCTACTGTYKSILVPFDASVYSQKALNQALYLAKINSAEVTALYVIPRYEEMLGFFRSESIRRSLHKEAQGILDIARRIASGNGSISLKTEIQEGRPGEEIIRTAANLKNDLIIMGSYGYSGVNKAIIGSTAERVITNASCPILIAR